MAKAGLCFWRLGYEGASIADLTLEMGITPQSLYAAFNSKAELYREAVGWYLETIGSEGGKALENPDIITGIGQLLVQTAKDFTKPGYPPGCMVSTAVLTSAVENEAIARHMAGLRSANVEIFRQLIERGMEVGQLRPDTDALILARFIYAMIQGMSVQAQDGASQQVLMGIVGLATDEIGRHALPLEA